MPFRLLARKPIIGAALANANATTNIPTGSWLQLVAAMPSAACAMSVFNSGAAPVQIGIGGAGVEKVLMIVGINESQHIVPAEIPKGSRLSAQVVGAAANSTGFTTLNFYQ